MLNFYLPVFVEGMVIVNFRMSILNEKRPIENLNQTPKIEISIYKNIYLNKYTCLEHLINSIDYHVASTVCLINCSMN